MVKKGELLLNMGDLENSRDCFEKVMKIDAKNKENIYFYGKLLLMKGDYEEAINLL